jgi:hypothetical protein
MRNLLDGRDLYGTRNSVSRRVLLFLSKINNLKSYKKVKLSLYRHTDTKGESKYSSYSFLTSALDGVSGQLHSPAELYIREWIPDTYWIPGWVVQIWSGQRR